MTSSGRRAGDLGGLGMRPSISFVYHRTHPMQRQIGELFPENPGFSALIYFEKNLCRHFA
jgi:hypothetical protein